MGLVTFGAVWYVRLVHARLSHLFLWSGGWVVLQKFLCVLIFSLFLQRISLLVVFFFLAAFQALDHCNLSDILSLLLLLQLSFGLLRDSVIASELLPLSILDNLPPSGLFLHFSRMDGDG